MIYGKEVKEVWRKIPGYKRYVISNFGRVKSMVREKHRILVACPDERGRMSVHLTEDSRGSSRRVHRLVLLAFVGLPPKRHECAHLDGNPSNNQLCNLKWATPKENASHKYLHGTDSRGDKSPTAKLKSSDINKIRILYDLGVSTRIIGVSFEVSSKAIKKIIHGKTWFCVKEPPLSGNEDI